MTETHFSHAACVSSIKSHVIKLLVGEGYWHGSGGKGAAVYVYLSEIRVKLLLLKLFRAQTHTRSRTHFSIMTKFLMDM